MTATAPGAVRFRAIVLDRRSGRASAECTVCTWTLDDATGRYRARLRAAALRHVRTTGHVVLGSYASATEYGPELGPRP